MKKRAFLAVSPAIWGLAFSLFVFATRGSLAADRDSVVLVVGIELALVLGWFVLSIVQVPMMIIWFSKGQGKLALLSVVGLIFGVLLWFLGMGLGPALIYVT